MNLVPCCFITACFFFPAKPSDSSPSWSGTVRHAFVKLTSICARFRNLCSFEKNSAKGGEDSDFDLADQNGLHFGRFSISFAVDVMEFVLQRECARRSVKSVLLLALVFFQSFLSIVFTSRHTLQRVRYDSES